MSSSVPPPDAPAVSPGTLSYEGAAPTRPPSSPAELTRGSTVDRYVVLDRVGEGGMGIVYAAYDPSLDRRVALKFLQTQDGGDGVREKRLLREAQAMARLSHPNVAVAYEVGIFHRHVFLAMEFVDGVDLRQWLADGTPSFSEILDVFRGAGRGLAAAHAAGIIHRDFKPANVLVDRQGRPRVTDFGLSRHAPDPDVDVGVEPEDGSAAAPVWSPSHLSMPLTRTGGVLGTPSYMSPEQRDGGAVDARSDQFSFCVALYEAVHGELPSIGEPAAPGAAPPSPPASSRAPRWCRQALSRGLSPDPEQRFASMDALLTALTPPTGGRRPVFIVGSIAVALAGAAGLALAMSGGEETAAPRCDLGAERLAGVWDAPRKRELEAAFLGSGTPGAEVVWKAFAGILDRRAHAWIAMNDGACKATHIDHLQSPAVLDLRVECLDRKRDEMKAIVGVFSGKLDTAIVDRAVGAADKLSTVSACADVANLRAVVPLPEDPIVRGKVRALRQRLDRSRVLYDAGQFKEGIEYMEGLVREASSLGYAPLTAEANHALAFHLTRLRPADAEKVLLDAATLAVEGRDWNQEAEILVTLVANYARAGRSAEGTVTARLAALAVARAHGDDALGARLANNSGMVDAEAGRIHEAISKFQRAQKLLERSSDVSSSRFAIVLFNIAGHLRDVGSTQEALRLLERAQAVQRSIMRPDHPDHAFVLTRLADAYLDLGQFGRAQSHYQRSLSRVLHDEPDQALTVLLTARLAQLSSLAGDHIAAREQHERLQSLQKRLLDKKDLGSLDTYMFIAEAEIRAGRYQDADRILHEALVLAKAAEQPAATANGLQLLGALDNRRSRFKDALGACRRALDFFRTIGETWNPNYIVVHECIGEALLGLGDAAAARKALEPAITPALDLEKGPQWTAGAKLHLARALWATGDQARAIALGQAAHRSLVGAEGDNRALIRRLEAWLKSHRAPKPDATAAAR